MLSKDEEEGEDVGILGTWAAGAAKSYTHTHSMYLENSKAGSRKFTKAGKPKEAELDYGGPC